MFSHFPGDYWLTPYGVMLTLACLVAWWLARQRALQAGIDPSHLDLALPLAFIGGAFFAGALGWLVSSEKLVAGPAFMAEGRLRLYVVAMIALTILAAYCRFAGLSLRTFADLVAVPALAFMAIVRVGCFLAGCCFGDVSGHAELVASVEDPLLRAQIQTAGASPWGEVPWAVRFPAGSFAMQQHQALGLLEPGAVASLPVHPVQLYETVIVTLLCLAIVRLRHSFRRPGSEALAVLGLYAALAFTLEFLRADNALVVGVLTFNQLICIGWLAIAAAIAAFPPGHTGRKALHGSTEAPTGVARKT